MFSRNKPTVAAVGKPAAKPTAPSKPAAKPMPAKKK